MMNFDRADEIFHSPHIYEVFFKESPIWITDLHADRATADIAESSFSINRTREVSVDELREGNEID